MADTITDKALRKHRKKAGKMTKQIRKSKLVDFRFLDLPAEIRNIIYRYVLVRDKPLRTSFIAGMRRKAVNVNLLRANRQIHAEASPILYGMNCFVGSGLGFNEETLLSWLQQIGECKKHLRSIRIVHIRSYQVLRSALHLLKVAHHMEKIGLGAGIPLDFAKTPHRSRRSRGGKSVDMFLPLLKCLRKARKARGEGGEVIEILEHYGCQEHQDDADKTSDAKFSERFEGLSRDELNTLISKALKLFADMQSELRDKLK